MKKTYQKPESNVVVVETQPLMSASNLLGYDGGILSQELSDPVETNETSGNLSRSGFGVWDEWDF